MRTTLRPTSRPTGLRRTSAVLGLLLSLCATVLVLPGVAATAADGDEEQPVFEPAFGATFNDPTTRKGGRLILRQVLKSVQATEPGELVRMSSWSYDDARATEVLTAAAARGVAVQVVVSSIVDTDSFAALQKVLNKDGKKDTFAVRCKGGCRSNAPIMHSKFYLFSRIGTHENVSMISSSNLTEAARYRQWNDLLVTREQRVYDFLGGIFDEFAQDQAVEHPFEVETLGDFRIWAFPLPDGKNPQAAQLGKVRCRGTTGGTGNRHHRTVVRVTVAGWFDTYGQKVADRLRLLWDRGCDVAVVTTLAGGGITRTLEASYGRGPIPMRNLANDLNYDGVPDRYLHQKSVAISGVFGKDTSASVVLTGSPNWSTRAARSEEVWLRLLHRPGTTRRYLRHARELFHSPFASRRVLTPSQLQRSLVHARGTGQPVPSWLELD